MREPISASQTGRAWIPGSPKTTSTPWASSASTRTWAPVRTAGGATVTPQSLLLRGRDECHEVGDVRRRKRLLEVRRHDPVGIARRDVLARVDDRGLDERVQVLAGLLRVTAQIVERGADRAARSGGGQRVAAAAAGAAGEDGLAVVRIAGGAGRRTPGRRATSGRRGRRCRGGRRRRRRRPAA